MVVGAMEMVGPNPFGEVGGGLTDSELRETAYEILIGACRSSTGSKPLTFIPQSEKMDRSTSSASTPSSPASLQRSMTSAAASKVKRALGIKPSAAATKGRERTKKTAVTVGEMIRCQMRVSEQTDSRVRRALLRIAAAQLGRRIELVVLPLELLQQLRLSDFANQLEFDLFQKRILKILEAGLLRYPHVPLEKADSSAQQLKQIIQGANEKPLDTGRNSESMQALQNVVMSLACRSSGDTASNRCHWADGFPLNLQLYRMLLEACFDIEDETSIIEEVDEILELIKKTWVTLDVNQELHNLCFAWVLFHRYVDTGEIEDDLLFAASNLLVEVENDAKVIKDLNYSKVLSCVLSAVLGWAEKRLLTYHDTFSSSNLELMKSISYLAVTSAKILVEEVSSEYRKKKRKEVDVARERVETYIRSSIRIAFAQMMEKVNLSKRSSERQQNPIPVLSVLAQEVTDLALNEREFYSPILKRWHPLAAGVAVATLHNCYGNELKQFIARVSELTPDAVQVLIAASKLEKELVQIAVEDAVESDDGGKAIIKEMPPYEAETAIGSLVKSWIGTRVERLKEWVDRNLQQEVWNVQANKERVAPSVVEVLRIVDETLEAFFLLPIPLQPALVSELIIGLDRCLQHYIMKAKSGCGAESTYIPGLPGLTRCSAGSKFFKKKEKSQMHIRKKSQVGNTNVDDPFGISQLCVRINSMQRIRSGVDALEKKTISYLRSSGSTEDDNGLRKKFELSIAAAFECILQLCQATGYKIVFRELSHVFWDSLYAGDVSSSRIEPFLQELEHYLEIIATTVHEKVRTRVITDVMKASFHGFLLVLIGGGPSRSFTPHDSAVIEEDFKLLCDLYWSNGDGLPSEIIDKHARTLKGILPLLSMDTETLIAQFRQVTLQTYGSEAKSRLPLPPTTGEWSATDANTLLRVLCHRDDEVAAKFLKRTYNLPTKLN